MNTELFQEIDNYCHTTLKDVAFTGSYKDLINTPKLSINLLDYINNSLSLEENNKLWDLGIEDTIILNYNNFLNQNTNESLENIFSLRVEQFFLQYGVLFYILTKNNIFLCSNINFDRTKNSDMSYFSILLTPIATSNYLELRSKNSNLNDTNIPEQLDQLKIEIKNIFIIIDNKYKNLYVKRV